MKICKILLLLYVNVTHPSQASRQQYIEELFGLIRLSIIPVADLIERVSNEDVINTNSRLASLICLNFTNHKNFDEFNCFVWVFKQ